MPLVTCSECLAKFDSSGARGASCPTCGHRLGSARRSDDEPRRPSRRRDYEDDDYDRRPVRRPRRERSTAADSLVPLLILGGALFVVLLVGGVGFLVYRAVERAPAPGVAVRPAESGLPGVPLGGGPNDDLPGVNPADLAPGGRPVSGPPGFPQPDDPSMPGVDPSPVAPPPGTPPAPAGPGKRPRPGPPQPPALPQPPGAAAATVTLSNLRRGRGAGSVLEVDYEYTAGSRQPIFDKLIVRTANSTGEVSLHGPPQRKGTVRIRALGFAGNLQGKVEVWMERRSPGTRPGASGQTISNVVTLD